MVLIDDEILDFVPSLQRERHASADVEIIRRSGSSSSAGKENMHGSRENSLGSARTGKLDNEPRSRCTSITMKTYKPHLISERRRKVEDLCRDLIVNNDHIHVIEMRLRAAIAKGLDKETHEKASVKCYPTYVRCLPTGEETGRFLALDLGGTNFRVLLMEIGDEKRFGMDSQIFSIEPKLMVGTGEALFDHIASCLASFVKEHHLEDEILPLGFTFSFPLIQEGLTKGRLAQWTKGFKCSSVEGFDVVDLLKQAIERRNDVTIDVVAILNDTTGCLMSCAWKEPKCRIGLILGTGTNACYLEDVEKVTTFNPENYDSNGHDHVVVNTEWGAFGDNGELDFVRTKWDEEVDAMSLNPGKQTFEKMISGMYMGELVRLVVKDMVEEGLMFLNQNTNKLRILGNFPTKYLSEIEADGVGEYDRCQNVLFKLGIVGASEADLSAIRYICECVSRRAGFMCAAGITALLKKIDYKDVVVAVDGSLFRHHPHFHNVMKSRVAQLMGIDYKFDMIMSEDGSGRGAALVAAVLKNNDLEESWKFSDYCNIM
eukprot:GFUD01037166.1.p1 GENE.GFUD01037166.1~~GFUD01037166.1.p1  ORF type:complete len:544 (+),score=125.53 GFUD01037166.1:103-1734(+)